ncbi:MAG: type II toxin-antitoxin system PemK/MazF family toxin [Candidatus Eremiobacteraeota bacterium]|nr:type II toxin-antitoxin system PemK/MazF family toxin [Candidatus Eremiobacteraeota bacterium]
MMRRLFYPKRRMILMCDFDRGGFMPPERVKRRRVVVLRIFGRIAIVVPLSAAQPREPQPYYASLDPTRYSSITVPVWAKANAITHVAFERLDRVRLRGYNYTELLTAGDFKRVLLAVAHATGIVHLDCFSTTGYTRSVPRESGLEGSVSAEPGEDGRQRLPFSLLAEVGASGSCSSFAAAAVVSGTNPCDSRRPISWDLTASRRCVTFGKSAANAGSWVRTRWNPAMKGSAASLFLYPRM